MAHTQPRSANGFGDPVLQSLFGHDFLAKLTSTDPARAPLRIGKQAWSVHDLATKLGVVNTKAARNLTKAAESIGAKSVHDLYRRATPYTLAGVERLGETTLWVLWRLFEAHGLDPDAWATAGDTNAAVVTFHTLKDRERRAERRTQSTERARRRAGARATHEAAVAAELTRAK
jgi:hypothetical protein